MMFFELPTPPHPRHAADLTYLRSLIFGILPALDFEIEDINVTPESQPNSLQEIAFNVTEKIDIKDSSKRSASFAIKTHSMQAQVLNVEAYDGATFQLNATASTPEEVTEGLQERAELAELIVTTEQNVSGRECVSDLGIFHNDGELTPVAERPASTAPESPDTPSDEKGLSTPTSSQPELPSDWSQYVLPESPAAIPIKSTQPFPDSPALFTEAERSSNSDSDHDCLERTIIFRTDNECAINNELDDAIDTMGADGSDGFSKSEPQDDPVRPFSHSSDTVTDRDESQIQVSASILPSFHPLAAASRATAIEHDVLNNAKSPKDAPLKRVLTLREQFQALQRLPILEINREFSDERLQFLSQLQSIREKSTSLNVLSDQVIYYATSFQKIVETAYNQFNSLEIESGPGSPSTVEVEASFSVNAFWIELKKFAAVENQHWLELLAKFRSVCLVPLCVDLQEIRNLVSGLFSEADALDGAIHQAETAHVASVQQFQQLTQKRALAYQKLNASKAAVPGRTAKFPTEPDVLSPSGEFEAEFLAAEIQRLAAEEQLRIYAETWKARLPAILSECRQLNQKRITTMHAAIIALLDFKNSIFSDRLCHVSKLQEIATHQLRLEEDLDLFNDPILGTGSDDSVCSNRSTNRVLSRSTGYCGNQISSEDAAAVVRDYFLSNDRPRSFVIDMWGSEGVRRTYEFLHSSKEVLTQVYTVLEGIIPAFESSSKQLKKVSASHQTSSAKYFNDEPIQQSWLSLLDAFLAESDANRNTAKFMKRAVAVLDHIRHEGKQLRVMFNRHQSQIEKQITNVSHEASQALEQKRSKSNVLMSSKDILNRNLDFSSCPDQNEFQPIVDHYLSSQQASLTADNEVVMLDRHRDYLQLKDEITTAVFLRFAQDCMIRHYTSTKRILQGVYRHLLAQNEASQRCLQRMERMVHTIDTENDLREFIISVENKHSNPERKRSEGDELTIKQQLDATEFNYYHSKSVKGIGSLRFLITLFQEASAIDDAFVRILRKFPWDFSSLRQSLKYSSLVGAYIQLQKTVECMGNCIDERSSRMKEISKSLKRQKSIIKTNITDIVQQHQAAHKRASSVESNFSNISTAYRKAVENVERISLRNEKEQEREKKTGHDRRQSFIVTMIQGRLPNKNPRQRMDSAVEVAERTQRALDHSAVSLKEALSSYSSMKKSHIQSLQNINATRINAVKWAFTTHCEHQTFYSQQMADFLSGFSTSIDRIDAESDLNHFVRSNGSNAHQPPDRVILSTLDPGSFSRLETDLSALDSCSYGETNATMSVRESTYLDQNCAESEISVDSSSHETNL